MRGEDNEAQMEGRRSFGPMTRRESDREEIFGDKQRKQISDDTIRIEGLNVNTIPINDDIRMEGLKNWATNSQASILPLTEINRNWTKIHPDQHPEHYMMGWWNQASINKTWLKDNDYEERNKRQYGGVAIITNNRLASTISARGYDKKKLGRWTWVTYRGRNNYRTTLICLYYPCNSTASEGTVYMQQATALDKKHPGEQKDPYKEYLSDLQNLLEEKIEKGENILVTGDFNQDIQRWNAPIVQLLHQHGLKELIAERHNNCQLPPTFDSGSHAIDGLFGSQVFQIEAGGYKEFGTNILSNHRAYWADIPIHQILGGGLETVVRPKGRRLQTHIPRIKSKYNLIVNREITRRKLVQRLQALYNSVKDTKRMDDSQLKKFNKMIAEQRRCMQIAERNCTKLRRGEVPYSEEVRNAMGKVVCWGLIVQREAMKGKKRRPHAKLVRLRIKRWKFTENYKHLTLKEMKKELKKADSEWRKLKPKALEKRDEFLSKLANDKSMEDGMKPESHLKQLRNLETIKNLFRRIKNATRKSIGGAASYIEVIQPDGSRKRITTQGPMERGIRTANEEKLQQVKNVDLRKEPLQSHFGEQGDLKKWEQIHRGELQLPTDYIAEPGLRMFMDAISKNHLPPIDIIPNDEEYNKSWKKMREKTSCAPPLHFGHFIAPNEGSPASLVNTMIGTIPCITGAIPDAWKECVNTMLVKKINDMRAEKLRLVTLLQPQYLHASKLANKQMMAHAEMYHALAAEQYGSRKRKNSRTHCLNKRLVYDLTRIQHAIMVLIANDLKSCYDRILMIIAYETMRHLGLSEQVSACLALCMMEMKHRIRTIFGDSEEYYGGDKWEGNIKPAGNGQGNGNGPGLWAGISSICLDIMREEGYGREMESAITQSTILLTGFAFVDDTDLIQIGTTTTETLKTAQEGLILWEQLMRATGGALEPTKSDWVMVNYQQHQGKWRLEPKKESRQLQVRGPDDVVQPLRQLSPTEARETLGIWQAPNGQEDTQTDKLKKSVEEWCSGIVSRCIPSRDIEIGIKSTIGRKIHYCLVATCMTKKQCKQIIDPVVRRVMPKMRLARNTARIIVHAPTSLLGVGIDHPYYSQLVEHVKVLVDVGGTDKHTGLILTNLIEEHLLECGRAGQIFDWDMKINDKLLTDTWMKFTLTLMQANNIHINSNHTELTKWREHDEYIMEKAFQYTHGAGRYSIDHMVAINKCRKYLQSTTIADICDGQGTLILDDAFYCRTITSSTSAKAYTWPRQMKPTAYEMNVWQDFLRLITTRHKKLRQQLGKWNKSAEKWHEWRYHPEYDRLYKKQKDGWKVWIPRRSRRTRRRRYQRTNTVADSTEIQQSTLAVIVTIATDMVLLQGSSPVLPDEQINRLPLRGKILDNGWAIQQLEIHHEHRIVEMIKNNTATGGTDGSYKEGQSSSGFNIFDDEQDLLDGGNHVPGQSKDQTSYRAELGGILGLIITVNAICLHHKIIDGSFTIGCDNDSALDVAFDEGEVLCTSSSFDIIRLIRYHLQQSPIKWNKQKVKGHQDKTTPYEELDKWGKSNIRADRKAALLMSTHPQHVPFLDPAGAGWTLTINGTRVVANTSRELYNHITAAPIKRYWATKNYIDLDEYDDDTLNANIQWDAISKMSKMVPRHQRIWITKHMAHISPTNYQMGPSVRKERDTEICPMCEEIERTNHVLECKSELTTQTFEEHYEVFETWIKKHSPPDLCEAILENFLAVREQRDPMEKDTWTDEVKYAFRSQCDMSIKAISSGLLHSSWLPIQRAHAKRNRSKMQPESWAGHVARHIWNITWEIWRARTEYLHSTEEGRIKILAATTDNQIDQIFHNLPANTWMTKAQRAYFSIPKRVVKGFKARRKIRWLKKATIARNSYESYLARTQNSASAQVMRNYVGYGQEQQQTNDNMDQHETQETNDEESNDSDYESDTQEKQQQQLRITDWINGNFDNG